MERHLVYLFLAAHREHAIPRQSQMLSSDPLQQNFSFWQHPDVKVITQVSIWILRSIRTLNRKQKRAKLKSWKVSPIQSVPGHIIRPSYVGSNSTPLVGKDPEIHDATGVHCMRDTGKLAASDLEYVGTFVKPGITTDEIDKAVYKMIISAGAYPSPSGYKGFPKSICTSVNECAFHGIPDFRPLEDGDIINIDVTVFLNGCHVDTSKTFLCGNVDDIGRQLVKVTEECL